MCQCGQDGADQLSKRGEILLAWVDSGEIGHPMVLNKHIAVATFSHGADCGGEAKMRGIATGIQETFNVMAAQGFLATDQHTEPHKLVGATAKMSFFECKRGVESVVTLQQTKCRNRHQAEVRQQISPLSMDIAQCGEGIIVAHGFLPVMPCLMGPTIDSCRCQRVWFIRPD